MIIPSWFPRTLLGSRESWDYIPPTNNGTLLRVWDSSNARLVASISNNLKSHMSPITEVAHAYLGKVGREHSYPGPSYLRFNHYYRLYLEYESGPPAHTTPYETMPQRRRANERLESHCQLRSTCCEGYVVFSIQILSLNLMLPSFKRFSGHLIRLMTHENLWIWLSR